MIDLLTIVKTERSSLLRGLLVMFALALPFSFLPTFIRHGFSAEAISGHLVTSVLFSGLIAIVVVGILLLSNYEKLLQKKRLYDLPAFTALQFDGAIEGYNSIIKHLSTYLLGKVGDYFFRVNIVNPGKRQLQIEISPLVYIGQEVELLEKIKDRLQLEESLYLTKVLYLTEAQLQQPHALLQEVKSLASELASFGVQPLQVDAPILSMN